MTASTPRPLPVLAEQIPAELQQGKRFVAWRYESRKGQPTKVPYSPESAPHGASATDVSHWITFDQALRYAQVAGLDGIGIVASHEDGLVWLDLDHCRDPETGEIAPQATDYVRRLDTYTEVTPSGTGLRMAVYATLPPHGRKRGDVEMYGAEPGKTGPCGRYLTLTGHQVPGTPASVGYRPDAVLAIHREVFGNAPDLTIATANDDPDRPIPALELGDEDVIRLAAESSHNGERFRRLWSGDTSDYASGGNAGASEADAALCELLAYYGGPDRERIDRLYRRSGLVREKWDERRLDSTYGGWTIDLALKDKTRFYGDSVQTAPAADSDAGVGHRDYVEANRLRRLLLDRDDLIEYQQSVICRERARADELHAQVRGWRVVLSNPHLKAADRIAAIPVIEDVRLAQKTGLAEIHVKYPGIVNGWGLKESTLGRSMAVLTEEGAPLQKRSAGVREEWGPNMRTYVWAADPDVDLYAAVGAYDPGLPQRGGRRLPQCPQHPSADVVLRTVHLCKTCLKPITPARQQTLCRQNEGIDEETTGIVSGVNSGRHFEGIGGGHDGAEQCQEAATATLPLPISIDEARSSRRPPGEAPWRCACGCYERTGDRCDGCNARIPPPAVSGGSE